MKKPSRKNSLPPILAQFKSVDFLSEDIKLKKNCQTIYYKVTINLYKLISTLNSNQLVLERKEDCEERVLRSNIHNKSRTVRNVHLLYMMFVLYITIKLFTISVLDLNYMKILTDWKPKLVENATRTAKCALKKDILFSEEDLKRKEMLDELAYHAGEFLSALPGIRSAITIFGGTFAAAFFLIHEYFLLSHKPHIDCLNFLLHPIEQREKFKRILNELVEKMARLWKRHADESNELDRIKFADDYYLVVDTYNQLGAKESLEVDESRSIFNLESKINLSLQCLRDVQIFNLLEPVVWTSFLHKIFTLFFALIFFFGIFAGTSLCFLSNVFVIGAELRQRAEYRSESVECQTWNENGTLIKDFLSLPELENKEELRFYRIYNRDSSWNNLIPLMMIELRLGLSYKHLLAYGEIFVFSYFPIFWCVPFAAIYIQDQLLKAFWLYQIRNQLLDCIELMQEPTDIKNLKEADKYYGYYKGNEKKLNRALIISYLNYELFRRHNNSHRKFMNFLFFRTGAATLVLMIVCYITGRFFQSGYVHLLLFESSLLTFMLNCYLLSGALVTVQVVNLMKLINKLIAFCSSLSLERSYIVELWIRQLMSDNEVKSAHSPCFVGYYVTSGTILTTNAYLVALWMLVINKTV